MDIYENVMTEIIMALMIYISSLTGWAVPPPPSIHYADSDKELFMIANNCYLFPEKSMCKIYGSKSTNILALYNPITKTVILNKNFSWVSIKDQSILLHELVHHMQYFSNYKKYKDMCGGLREKEAYQIQSKWLAKRKLKLLEVMNMNDLYYLLMTSCTYYRHF